MNGFVCIHLIFKLLVLSFPVEILLVPLHDNRVCNHSAYTKLKVRQARSKDGANVGVPRWIEIENLECVEGRRSRKPDVCLTLLECTGKINPYTL